MGTKNENIEALRGITIALVVIGHVIGSDSGGGMKVADGSFLRYFYLLFENIRMPLFTVISGWVYAIKPINSSNTTTFILKKARRLLLPLLFVGSIYFLLQYLIPGTNVKESLSNIWRIYVFPYTIFWYLPALFITFLLTALLEQLHCLRNIKTWSVALVLSLGLYFCMSKQVLFGATPNLFAFKNAIYLLPFFILGLGANRFKEQIYSGRKPLLYLAGLSIGVALQQLYFFFPTTFAFYQLLRLDIFIGIVSTVYLLSMKFKSAPFVWLAQYAYTIYLFHGFGTSGGRIILLKLGITSDALIVVIASAIAIFAPILVDKVLGAWGPTRLLFLGKAYHKRRTSAQQP